MIHLLATFSVDRGLRMYKVMLIIVMSVLVPLLTVGCPSASTIADSRTSVASSGRIRAIAGMAVGRAAHTSTLLNNGRVLIVGGLKNGGSSLHQAELFLPETGVFQTVGSLATARAGHTAILLPDGKVLIAGGFDGTYLDSAELYDPKTERFSSAGSLTMPRSEHTATKLPDGRILLTGGVGTGWTFLADAETYDPRTFRFTPTGRMTTPRESHTATILKNGKVLITGGHKDRRTAMTIFASTEIYDPHTGIFQPAAALTIKRHKHDAVLLRDGRVLISGGSDERDSRGAYKSIEIFEPKTGRFRKVTDTVSARYKLNGAVVLLDNGNVLLAGGSDTAEIFDPATSMVSAVDGAFGSQRLFSTATLLKDGRVLITGGYDAATRVGQGAWIFEPNVAAK